MKKMSIYEPAMCCETGICGINVNPELLRISTVLNNLKKNGIEINRFNLTSAPMEFVNNKNINDFVNTKSVDELPAVMVDGEIVITGRYPKNEEIAQLLEIPLKIFDSKAVKQSGCCCEGGSCC